MIDDMDEQRSPNLSSYIQIIGENLPNINKPKHPKTKVERKGTRWKDPSPSKMNKQPMKMGITRGI